MTISPDTIEQIRLRTDIADVVREYIPTLKRAGRHWKANCPFHNEKTPSFMVNPEKGIFHCFGCNAGGDVFSFVMQMDHLTWPEAVRKLAARTGITVAETREETIRRSEKQKLYDLLEQAAQFYHRCLISSAEGKSAREYLKKRGVSDETIETFAIGFAPKGKLLPSASRKGYTADDLSAAGLLTKTERGRLYEYMSDRVVFPIFDTQGRVVAFGGRTLKDEQPKYLNTPETALYSKSHQLYGLFQAAPALRKERDVLLLEGYMDVVMSHQYGVKTAIATLGTAFTPVQAQLLSRYADRITILFDADPAGVTATRRAVDTLITSEREIRISRLPDGVDPDEFLLKEGTERFRDWLKEHGQSIIEFMFDYAAGLHGEGATPESKVRIAAEVLPVIARAGNAVLQREWIHFLAERLHTTEDALRSELKRLEKTGRAAREEKAVLPAKKGPMPRSAEDEILHLICSFPQLRGQVSPELFKEERHKRLYELITQDVPVADIVNHIDEKEVGWFTELVLEETMFAAPEQVLAGLLRDVKHRELETQRQALQKEVIKMTSGQIPMDEDAVRRYQDLTKQLKGSVKE